MDAQNGLPLQERVVLITGANTGIGLVTARELARMGAHVFLACRSRERTERASALIRASTGREVSFLPLDLGVLGSVERCATAFLETGLPLHLLINNAGLAGARGITPSGFEIAFGVHHVGHFLLTKLLLPRLLASAPARIVTVSSRAHFRIDGLDFAHLQGPTRTLTAIREYQASKLANVLFSAELARRLAGTGVTTYSLHPGVVASDIWRGLPWPARQLIRLRPSMISVEEGAKTTLHCATSPEVASESGLYYDSCRVIPASDAGRDAALAEELWRRSEAWVA